MSSSATDMRILVPTAPGASLLLPAGVIAELPGGLLRESGLLRPGS